MDTLVVTLIGLVALATVISPYGMLSILFELLGGRGR